MKRGKPSAAFGAQRTVELELVAALRVPGWPYAYQFRLPTGCEIATIGKVPPAAC